MKISLIISLFLELILKKNNAISMQYIYNLFQNINNKYNLNKKEINKYKNNIYY